jgi:hypothetical protein
MITLRMCKSCYLNSSMSCIHKLSLELYTLSPALCVRQRQLLSAVCYIWIVTCVCNRVRIWCETAECYREAVVEACHTGINTSTSSSTDNSTAAAIGADSTPTTAGTAAGTAAGAAAASTNSNLYTGKWHAFHTLKC